MFLNQTKQLRRAFSSGSKQRNFMSSMIAAAPEEEGHFALILGKPGGGKGTISCKILKVCFFRQALDAEFFGTQKTCC
jgi:hypothetical protein